MTCNTSACGCTPEAADRWTYRPEVDIVELDDRFEIAADIAGAERESIDVTLEEGVLTINAAVKPRTPENVRHQRAEFGVGGYHRRFQVGDSIDASKLAASYDAGVLTVSLPKREAAKVRRIAVA